MNNVYAWVNDPEVEGVHSRMPITIDQVLDGTLEALDRALAENVETRHLYEVATMRNARNRKLVKLSKRLRDVAFKPEVELSGIVDKIIQADTLFDQLAVANAEVLSLSRQVESCEADLARSATLVGRLRTGRRRVMDSLTDAREDLQTAKDEHAKAITMIDDLHEEAERLASQRNDAFTKADVHEREADKVKEVLNEKIVRVAELEGVLAALRSEHAKALGELTQRNDEVERITQAIIDKDNAHTREISGLENKIRYMKRLINERGRRGKLIARAVSAEERAAELERENERLRAEVGADQTLSQRALAQGLRGTHRSGKSLYNDYLAIKRSLEASERLRTQLAGELEKCRKREMALRGVIGDMVSVGRKSLSPYNLARVADNSADNPTPRDEKTLQPGDFVTEPAVFTTSDRPIAPYFTEYTAPEFVEMGPITSESILNPRELRGQSSDS